MHVTLLKLNYFNRVFFAVQNGNKTLQGKDLGDMQDKNGVYLVRELRDKAKAGGGLLNIYGPN